MVIPFGSTQTFFTRKSCGCWHWNFAQNMNSSGLIFPMCIGHAQVTLFNLAQGFLELQSVCSKTLSSRSPVVNPQSFVYAIGFPHNQSDCCHNAWITLFQFYFDFLELSSHYRGLEVLWSGQQPQPFSCLLVYVSGIGLDIIWATPFSVSDFPINLTILFLIFFSFSSTS